MRITQETLQEDLTEFWQEAGFTSESTKYYLSLIQDALQDQGLKVNIQLISDCNDYE